MEMIIRQDSRKICFSWNLSQPRMGSWMCFLGLLAVHARKGSPSDEVRLLGPRPRNPALNSQRHLTTRGTQTGAKIVRPFKSPIRTNPSDVELSARLLPIPRSREESMMREIV